MTRNIDDKDLDNITGAGDSGTFNKTIGGGPGAPEPTKDPMTVPGEEEPIGGSPGVQPVEDPEGLGGGGGGGTFGQ